MTEGPAAAYRALLRGGGLRPDPEQQRAAETLELLHRQLHDYRTSKRSRWPRRFGHEKKPPPRGVYLHGRVGRGKTMLMDLFFDSAPSARKQRTHFHAFMVDVHRHIHAWRRNCRNRANRAGSDPISPLAEGIAARACLLCFDELEVLDIADAMIVARLFSALLELGVVVVMTSNRAPRQLYLGGLQRDRFLPFIDLLERRFDVVHLDGETDYRLAGFSDATVYFTPLGPEAEAALDESFARLTGGAEAFSEVIKVQGRDIVVPIANCGIARFGFADLCEKPLGAADYLAVARRYHTVVLSDVPRLVPDQRNEARRFGLLVDVFYDHAVKLICSAAAAPHMLYIEGSGADEFRRAASRLVEMQTAPYLSRPHKP